MYDAIVIGAGLFGNVIAAALRQYLGHRNDVLVIDDHKPHRGSFPAACLMKPSWLGSMVHQDRVEAIELLDKLYRVQPLEFRLPLGKHTVVDWVNPQLILQPPEIAGTVQSLKYESGYWTVMTHLSAGGLHVVHGKRVICAAGIWTDRVLALTDNLHLPMLKAARPTVEGQAGVAFLFPHAHIDQPFIRPWAPYKQLVAFNRGDGLWIGDGSAIKQANWTAERTQACFQRCLNALAGAVDARDIRDVETLYGVRPYVAGPLGKPAYLQELYEGFYVATGGAKNGTAGAAWCANQLLKVWT